MVCPNIFCVKCVQRTGWPRAERRSGSGVIGKLVATGGSIGFMSETPEEMDDPLELRIQAVSALEKAMREALAVIPLEQIALRLSVMWPKSAVEIDTAPGSQFRGRVQKVSVSMPEELTATVRARTGPGGFSRYVTEAVEERLRLELMDEFSAELAAANGPVSPEELEEAMREWPDYEE